MTPKNWTDLRIEIIIGSLLRTGVLLAASVVLIGGVLYLARHGHETVNYTTFHGEPQALKSIPAVIEARILSSSLDHSTRLVAADRHPHRTCSLCGDCICPGTRLHVRRHHPNCAGNLAL